MLAITIRMKYLKIATLGVLLTVLVSLAVLAVLSAQRGAANGKEALLITNEDRVAYLNRCGWVVSDAEESVRDVLIPAKFNAVYEEYNRLQKEQGFDLSDCRGMTAKEYTYTVKNHPYSPENVEAHLLFVEERLVGGDVSYMELNGFMQGLKIAK